MIAFREGCARYMNDCRTGNLREGTIGHYRQSYVRFYKYFDPEMPLSDFYEKDYQNYDTIELPADGEAKGFLNADQTLAQVVVFRKRIDGTYYVVEALPESKYKKLWVISAYKTKRGDITQRFDALSSEKTSETSSASLSPEDSIAQAEDSRQENIPTAAARDYSFEQ